ncbi:MAG: phage capsid protein [Tagaea sp.]|nr:phage capsid protein [Tagaea sp.]
MSMQIANSFVKNYEAEIHDAYQRMGSKLRDTVRSKKDIQAASTVFQKMGKGAATTKARHAQVPVMNVEHSTVEVFLKDYYAGEWLDKLDEFKANGDERGSLINAGAYALGRKTDELIIEALDAAPTPIAVGTTGLTKVKVLEAFERLGGKDVPDDGDRFAVVGWAQWSDLLDIEEFANADYIGEGELPWNGSQAKRWLGTLWIPHSGLTKTGNVRRCHWFHKSAIGHASGHEVKSDVTWHGDRASYFISNMMSQGAAIIDADGVVGIDCQE